MSVSYEAMRATFSDPALCDLAMMHRGKDTRQNNQRLEFLGDRVLGLVMARMLYTSFPDEREGELAMRLSALVCGTTIACVARQLGMGAWLILDDHEVRKGGRDNESNLIDACEALIGAIYLDQGIGAAEAFIHTHWHNLMHSLVRPPKDAKTALQEWVQARGLPLPLYHELSREGTAHDPLFTIEVQVEGVSPIRAIASNKKQAEHKAAQLMLQHLGEERTW